MGVSTAQDVFDSFEASFQDKREIPYDLEMLWLEKAIARYSIELEELTYDKETNEFSEELNQYVIDTLGAFMKQSYQEREVSKVNKRVSIVGKDLSVDGNGNTKSAAKNELEYDTSKSAYMKHNQMITAYS